MTHVQKCGIPHPAAEPCLGAERKAVVTASGVQINQTGRFEHSSPLSAVEKLTALRTGIKPDYLRDVSLSQMKIDVAELMFPRAVVARRGCFWRKAAVGRKVRSWGRADIACPSTHVRF